jgi:hypothetical protein
MNLPAIPLYVGRDEGRDDLFGVPQGLICKLLIYWWEGASTSSHLAGMLLVASSSFIARSQSSYDADPAGDQCAINALIVLAKV